jgi:hypothetical protein
MPDTKSEIFNKLASYVLRRYQVNARKSMLDVYQVDRDFLRLEKDNLEFMYENRPGIIAIINDRNTPLIWLAYLCGPAWS